jgi:hypothetical protein
MAKTTAARREIVKHIVEEVFRNLVGPKSTVESLLNLYPKDLQMGIYGHI